MSLPEAMSDAEHLRDNERECLERCLRAVEVCEWCADACIGEGEEMAECVRQCRDVADIATLHARLIARDSAQAEAMAGICASVCEACAEECEKHDDEHCQACVEVLSDCAESCESMVA